MKIYPPKSDMRATSVSMHAVTILDQFILVYPIKNWAFCAIEGHGGIAGAQHAKEILEAHDGRKYYIITRATYDRNLVRGR